MGDFQRGRSSKDLRRVHRRFLWIEVKERLIDLAMISFPIFVVTGIGAACLKFWGWVFGL